MADPDRIVLTIVGSRRNGCWFLPRDVGHWRKDGYVYLRYQGQSWLAHRLAYTLLVGPILDGLTIDHVKANGCTSKACVKAIADEFGPAHLEPVTSAVNTLRGDSPPARNARKPYCPKGHAYTTGRNGRRRCLICRYQRRLESGEIKGYGSPENRTHCPKGHLYDEANTYRDLRGSRVCRTCNREKARRAYRAAQARRSRA